MAGDSAMRALVRGWWWKCRMKNGVTFQVWNPESMGVVGRKQARAALLKIANAAFEDGMDEAAYTSSDIATLWEARSEATRD